MERRTGAVLAVVGVAIALWQSATLTPYQPAVWLGLLLVFAGLALIAEHETPAARHRRARKEARTERAWRVDFDLPLSLELAYAVPGQLAQAELSDGLVVTFDPDDQETVYCSVLVLALDRRGAEAEAWAGLRRAGLVAERIRARPRPGR